MKPRLSRDVVGATLFLALGGLIVGMATGLSMGSMRLPGPGALPLAIGIALVGLAIVQLTQTVRQPVVPSSNEGDETEPQSHSRVLLVCALIAVFVLVLPLIGFLPATALLMTALYVVGAGGHVGTAQVAAGVITALVAYAIFALLLDVPLPRGSLWGL